MYPTRKTDLHKTCSFSCVYNWINYSQKQPRWQSCSCCPPKTNLKIN